MYVFPALSPHILHVLSICLRMSHKNRPSLARQVLRTQMPAHIQGNSLKTWITQPYVEAVHVALKSEGRPIHADVELWNGPNNIPYKLRVYVEDGYIT